MSAAKRGYDRAWKRTSDAYLAENPLCVDPHGDHIVRVRDEYTGEYRDVSVAVEATDVDHIIPHCNDMGLFYDWDNLQSLCHACHGKKTATEDGGFGNRKKG